MTSTDISTLKTGDLIEGVVAGKDRYGRALTTIKRVLIDRTPWMVNGKSATVTDGDQVVVALVADSIQLIDPEAPSSPACPIHGPGCAVWEA